MRLAIVTQLLAPYRIGLFQAYARRVEALRIFVLAGAHSDRHWRVDAEGFDCEVLPGFHVALPAYPVRGLRERLHVNVGVGRALRRFAPTVVMSGGFSPAHYAAYRYARRSGIRHYSWGELTLRDGAQRSALKRALRRAMIRGSAGCIASSSVARNAFLHYGAQPQAVLTALMPVNLACFRAASLRAAPSAGSVVLSAGRLVRGKGFHELLEAVAMLRRRRPEVRLRIVGAGEEEAPLRSRAAALGLAELTTFLGALTQDQLADECARATVFVCASHYDAFGAVIPEAMAAGTLVVASVHAAATHDLVDDGVTGYRVHPEDPAAIAATLDRALALDPADRARMIAAAAAAVERLDVDRSANATIGFLRAGA
ncbi:MAG: glycosyltransferase [Proteobacteria bacterium]|nr:glycosyltransferase [Pseudomonadota bacterium]